MAKDIEYSISRDDLPEAGGEFGLEDQDFDLTKAKVWVDDIAIEPSRREKARLVVVVGHRPRTIVITTEAGKPIAFLEGDKIPSPSKPGGSQGKEHTRDRGQTP